MIKYLSASPFQAWGMCATETPKENFQETENRLSLHEKTELEFISSTQLCGEQELLNSFWKRNGDPSGVA